jgi:hypothetical protein
MGSISHAVWSRRSPGRLSSRGFLPESASPARPGSFRFLGGGGAYWLTMAYVANRLSVMIIELVFMTAMAMIPGLLLFLIWVRIYYWLTDA